LTAVAIVNVRGGKERGEKLVDERSFHEGFEAKVFLRGT
jgi:hypothetical protein